MSKIYFLWVLFSVMAISDKKLSVNNNIFLIDESLDKNFMLIYYQNEFQDQINVKFELDTLTGKRKPAQIISNHPLWLQLATNSDQYTLYVEPGDSIFIQTHPDKSMYYTFRSSKNGSTKSDQVNFFNSLKKYNLDISLPDFSGLSVNEKYQNKIDIFKDKFNKRALFLKKQSDSLNFSYTFQQFAVQQIKIQYLSTLLYPFWDVNMKFKQFSPVYYETIDSAKIAQFLKNDELVLVSPTYRGLAVSYIRYLNRDSINSSSALSTEYQLAHSLLIGETKNYVQFFMLKQRMGKYSLDYIKCYNKFKIECSNRLYVNYLDSLLSREKVVANKINLLKTELVDNLGKNIYWQDIINANKGKVVYVDLWASWCKPCLAEIPASEKLQKKLIGKDIVYLYLSIDSDVNKWYSALAKYKLVAPGRQHYLVNQNSSLAKSLKVPPIPRYMIMNKNGQFFSIDAPRPSNPLLLKDIENLL